MSLTFVVTPVSNMSSSNAHAGRTLHKLLLFWYANMSLTCLCACCRYADDMQTNGERLHLCHAVESCIILSGKRIAEAVF